MVVRAVKQTAQVVEGEVVLAPEPSFRPPATDALQAQGGDHALAEMPCVPSQAGPLPCPLPLVYVGIPPSVQGTLLDTLHRAVKRWLATKRVHHGLPSHLCTQP